MSVSLQPSVPVPVRAARPTRLEGWRIALFLLLVTALVRVANISFVASSPLFLSPTSDEHEHFSLAARLASGDWLDLGNGPFFRPPLFAYVCALLFSFVGPSFLAVHGLILICDTLAIVAWYALARRCFPKVPAFLGALAICAYGPFIHFAATGYMESFSMALNSVFLLLLAMHSERAVRQARHLATASPWTVLAGAGVLAGLSILTRPTVMLLLPGFGLVLLWLHVRLNRRLFGRALIAPALFLVVTCVTIAPNAIRHWAYFRLWAPIGVASEMAFHMGNNDDGWGWHVSSPGIEFIVYRNMPLVEDAVPENVPEVRRWWGEQNRNYVLQNPDHFLRRLGFKVLQTWNRYEVHLTNNFREMKRLSPLERFALSSGVVLPFGILGLFFAVQTLVRRLARRPPAVHREDVLPGTAATFSLFLLVLWSVPYMFGVALYMANTRHRLPALPPLVLLGGLAVWVIWRRLRDLRRRRRELVVPLLVLMAAFGIVWLPVTPAWMAHHEKWWTKVNLGIALQDLKRPEDAVRELQQAVGLMPEKLEGWRQLAAAFYAASRPAEAAAAQKNYLDLFERQYPKYRQVRIDPMEQLIRFQMAAGETTGALNSARQLVELAPDRARSRLFVADALREAGKTKEALAELDTALRLEPGDRQALYLQDEILKGSEGLATP